MVDLSSTNSKNPKFKYKAIGIGGVDENGKAKTIWFDIFGDKAISTASGDFNDKSVALTDSSAVFKGTRTIEVKDNQMIVHTKGIKTIDGKDVPFDTTTIYKKKK